MTTNYPTPELLSDEAARLRQFCYEHGHTAEEHAAEIESSLNRAATRMRERCVNELNSLLLEYELEQQERTEDEGRTHRIVRAAILAMQRAIARVESLTLEGTKEQ